MIQMECIHGFENPEWCSYCKKAPEGIRDIVYWTSGGDVFHNLINCELLASGQHMANRVGMTNKRVETGKFASVSQRGACSWCCAYYYAVKRKENKRCFVKIKGGDSNWIEVQFLAARILIPAKEIFEYRVRTDDGQELIVRKPNIVFSKDLI